MTRVASILLLLLACGPVAGDQLTLKNGDRITGTVVKADGKTLVFKGELVGELTIALDSVAEVITDKALYVVMKDGNTVNGVVKLTADQTEIKTRDRALTVARSSIIHISEPTRLLSI